MSVFDTLIAKLGDQRANYLILIDPDRKNDHRLADLVEAVNRSGADGILVGGSLIMDGRFDERMAVIREKCRVPIITFPGASNQISQHADAVLFMSLVSGRNPQFLIGEQVRAAPVIRHFGLETIPTGYMLMDGGSPTAVQFMSDTHPLPMNKPDLVVAHALAAQYLGMNLVYLEAGSGAKLSVPTEVVQQVSSAIDIPVMVGGGIRTPEAAAEIAEAGASFIVTGTIAEEVQDYKIMTDIAKAVHQG